MEIEIKLRVKNKEAIKDKLLKLGAIQKGTSTNIDHYFTVKHRDFMKTKECLRVRELPEKNISILTYKPATTKKMEDAGFMWKDEMEIEVEDGMLMSRIFECLDCRKLATVHKVREKFVFRGFNVVMDELKGVGFFMEIEMMGEDVEEAESGMWKIIGELGLGKGDVEAENYRDLVMKASGVYTST